MMISFLLLVLLIVPLQAVSGETLVVLNKADSTASLIDIASGKTMATVPTGKAPHEVAVSPDGALAVVSNYGNRESPGSTLSVIKIADGTVSKTIDLGSYKRPHGISWLPGKSECAVTVEENRAIIIVDVNTGEVKQTIQTDQEVSHMIAINKNATDAYVANIGSGSISALNLSEGKLRANVPTAAGAEGIEYISKRNEVWVTNRAADTISIVDASTLKVIATLVSKSFPIRVKATPNGSHALISNARTGELSVIDVAERKVTGRISFSNEAKPVEGRIFGDFGNSPVPIGIVIPPDGSRAFVALSNADVVAEVDLKSFKVTRVLNTGKEPDGIAFSKAKSNPK